MIPASPLPIEQLSQLAAITGISALYRKRAEFRFPVRLRLRRQAEPHEGDTAPPHGVKLWHAAATDSWFARLAIDRAQEESRAGWLESASGADYDKLPRT